MEKVLHPLGFWSCFAAGLYFLFPFLSSLGGSLPAGRYPVIVLFLAYWGPPIIGALILGAIGGGLGTLIGQSLDGQRRN